MEVVVTGHDFESMLHKDHPCHVCFKLADWFQKRRLVVLTSDPMGKKCFKIFSSETSKPI
jgi:phosphopantetheine adenylyltransferase